MITYVKDHLTISHKLSRSDSTTDFLCMYIQELKLALITIYRPPRVSSSSFHKCLHAVDGWMKALTKEICDARFIVTGDFNLGMLESWTAASINKLVDSTSQRIENDFDISIDKEQALNLLEFADRWVLSQKVQEATRESRILNLVLTDSDQMVKSIFHEKHCNISDHDTLLINLNLEVTENEKEIKKNFSSTTIPDYNTEEKESKRLP